MNTLTDFSVPGTLGVFTDEATIAGLEKQMAKSGYLDSDKMAHTFDALRANDLIFQYVGNNWLLGNKPPAFDLLVWNKDSTRMPAKMHSQYLRSCYLRNEFARGEFEIEGQKLEPSKVDVDTYVLSAVDDHIVPWVVGLQDHAAVQRPQPVRPEHLRAHRRDRQPSRPQAQALDERRPAGESAGLEGHGAAAGRHLVGGLGSVGRRRGRSHGRPSPQARQQGPPTYRGRARQLRARRGVRTRRAGPHRARLVRVDGLEICVRVEGEGDDPPLLLLNGLGRSLQSWDPFTRALSCRTIVSFDAPGVGGSPTPVLPLSISMLARVAASVLDETQLDSADVLGFSHGGAVAQQLAIDAPARIRHLVLASTSCGLGAIPGKQDLLALRLASEARLLARLERCRDAVAVARHLELVEHPVSRCDPCPHPRHLRDPRPHRAACEQRLAGPTHPRGRAGALTGRPRPSAERSGERPRPSGGTVLGRGARP